MAAYAPTGTQHVITRGSTRATVVEVGGGLRTFDVGGRPVVAGFDPARMAAAGRGQVLIPWPNRIADGRYTWEGSTHQLPINEVDRSTAIHGLVRFAAWHRVAGDDDRLDLVHELWPSPGYPFALETHITYEVRQGALTVTTTTRNRGDGPAPYGTGQHPYLAPPSGALVDDCILTVPAEQVLTTDDRGLPEGIEEVSGSAFDFRSGRRIGDIVLDTTFTELARDDKGRAVVDVTGAEGRSVKLWMDAGYRYVQVFTADTLPVALRRASLAIEPMTCPPNAFASGVDVLRLEPGESVTTTWGIEAAS